MIQYNIKNEKTYSERKQELKKYIMEYLEEYSLQRNLRALYFRDDYEKNMPEIRNIKILIAALKQIVIFIDEPSYKHLYRVKWLANEFDYSDKILMTYRIYSIFRPLTTDDNLGKAIIPMIEELLKGFGDNYQKFDIRVSENKYRFFKENEFIDSDSDSDSDSDTDTDTD